jgi:hypothetical protein
MPSCRATSSSDSTAPCEKPPRQVAAGATSSRACCKRTQGASRSTCAATRAGQASGVSRRPSIEYHWRPRRPPSAGVGASGTSTAACGNSRCNASAKGPRARASCVQPCSSNNSCSGFPWAGRCSITGCMPPLWRAALHSPGRAATCRLCSAPPPDASCRLLRRHRCRDAGPAGAAAWHGLARPAPALGRAVRAVHGHGCAVLRLRPLAAAGRRSGQSGRHHPGRAAAADDAGRADRLRRAAATAGPRAAAGDHRHRGCC